jgi:hypothetical protein
MDGVIAGACIALRCTDRRGLELGELGMFMLVGIGDLACVRADSLAGGRDLASAA